MRRTSRIAALAFLSLATAAAADPKTGTAKDTVADGLLMETTVKAEENGRVTGKTVLKADGDAGKAFGGVAILLVDNGDDDNNSGPPTTGN